MGGDVVVMPHGARGLTAIAEAAPVSTGSDGYVTANTGNASITRKFEKAHTAHTKKQGLVIRSH